MPIFIPSMIITNTAKVTKPIPPIWMRRAKTTWPNLESTIPTFIGDKPVTHTAEVEVKNASTQASFCPFWIDIGNFKLNRQL